VQLLTCAQLAFDYGSTCMQTDQTIACESLHDETFPTKQARQDATLKMDADRYPLSSTQETIFLADQRPPTLISVTGIIVPG